MNRFFVESQAIQADNVVFNDQQARQIWRVLRMKPGDQCIVLDNLGGEMTVELAICEEGACTGRILERKRASEPAIRLLMILALTQREKFEWMLQKCTEVGAGAFLPVVTSRTLVQSPADAMGKYERWGTILREAAEQCGRGRIPELLPVMELDDAVRYAGKEYKTRLLPWEGERRSHIKEYLRGNSSANTVVLIGPEGGFSEEEVAFAVKAGFTPVTLGERILRMETAAVVAGALVMYEWG